MINLKKSRFNGPWFNRFGRMPFVIQVKRLFLSFIRWINAGVYILSVQYGFVWSERPWICTSRWTAIRDAFACNRLSKFVNRRFPCKSRLLTPESWDHKTRQIGSEANFPTWQRRSSSKPLNKPSAWASVSRTAQHFPRVVRRKEFNSIKAI